uniref:Lyase_1 domain-containing protein n=1 Tax=Macrostomum lignano TaxID=282301 RepID=A0A1I8FJC4_9PLAT
RLSRKCSSRTRTFQAEVYRSPWCSLRQPRDGANFGDRKKIHHLAPPVLWLAESQQQLVWPSLTGSWPRCASSLDLLDLRLGCRGAERKQARRHGARVHAFAAQCPRPPPSSTWAPRPPMLADNTDLICLRDALDILLPRLAAAIAALSRFAGQHRSLACLGFTHLQARPAHHCGQAGLSVAGRPPGRPAQPQPLPGPTCASAASKANHPPGQLLQLFTTAATTIRVERLDKLVTAKAGFPATYIVTGRPTARKVDSEVLLQLAGFGATAHKIATDLRLLASWKEIEEPFERDQIGFLAMRRLNTHSVQWMERTLDDSSNRRLSIRRRSWPPTSLPAPWQRIRRPGGLPMVIQRHLKEELPFMATENILAAMVKAGGNRQPSARPEPQPVKERGLDNDLIERIQASDYFPDSRPGCLSCWTPPPSWAGRLGRWTLPSRGGGPGAGSVHCRAGETDCGGSSACDSLV